METSSKQTTGFQSLREKKERFDRLLDEILGRNSSFSSEALAYGGETSKGPLDWRLSNPVSLVEKMIEQGGYAASEVKAEVGKWLLARSTVSDQQRRKNWMILADVVGNIRSYPGLYDRLCESFADQATGFRKVIEIDVKRTNANLSAENQLALNRILLSFVKRNMRVGYCQGMNFIAEFLHVEMGFSEEETFWLLSYIVETQGESYYSNLVFLSADLSLFKNLFARSRGEAFARLAGAGLDVSTLALSWLVTAFAKLRNPAPKALIFDQFFAHGNSALLKTALSAAELLASRIPPSEELNDFLLRLDEIVATQLRPSAVRRLGLEFFLHETKLTALRRKFAREAWKKAQKDFEKSRDTPAKANRRAAEACQIWSPFCAEVRAGQLLSSFEEANAPLIFRVQNVLAGLEWNFIRVENEEAFSDSEKSQQSENGRRSSLGLSLSNLVVLEPEVPEPFEVSEASEVSQPASNPSTLVIARSKHICSLKTDITPEETIIKPRIIDPPARSNTKPLDLPLIPSQLSFGDLIDPEVMNLSDVKRKLSEEFKK